MLRATPIAAACYAPHRSLRAKPSAAADRRRPRLLARRSYDVKFVEVCAEGVQKFEAQRGRSKPLFVLFKTGLEVGRLNEANGNALEALVQKNKGSKKVD